MEAAGLNHSTPPPNKADIARFEALRALGCIACRQPGDYGPRLSIGNIEIHHLLSGNRRRGHQFTIPLCRWHHQGIRCFGFRTTEDMAAEFGPSLKLESRRFRATYGRDDDLLAEANKLLAGGA